MAAARSAIRSCSSSLRTAAMASRVAPSSAAAARSSLPRLLKSRPAAPQFLRSPVEMSFGVESLLPMHSATASALMTSMLSVSRRGYRWLSEEEWIKGAMPHCVVISQPFIPSSIKAAPRWHNDLLKLW